MPMLPSQHITVLHLPAAYLLQRDLPFADQLPPNADELRAWCRYTVNLQDQTEAEEWAEAYPWTPYN